MEPIQTLHMFMVLFLFIFQVCDYYLTSGLLRRMTPPVWEITDKLYLRFGDNSLLVRYLLSFLSLTSLLGALGNHYIVIALFITNGLMFYMVINKYDRLNHR
jgi:hypothetical protein